MMQQMFGITEILLSSTHGSMNLNFAEYNQCFAVLIPMWIIFQTHDKIELGAQRVLPA